MAEDIVAWLDGWLAANYDETSYSEIKPVTVRRARDEIVALRKGVADGGWVWEQLQMTHKAARDEALEEAAQVVKRICDSPTIVAVAGENAAGAIRALKEPR